MLADVYFIFLDVLDADFVPFGVVAGDFVILGVDAGDFVPFGVAAGDFVPFGVAAGDFLPLGEIAGDFLPLGVIAGDFLPLGVIAGDFLSLGEIAGDFLSLGEVAGDFEVIVLETLVDLTNGELLFGKEPRDLRDFETSILNAGLIKEILRLGDAFTLGEKTTFKVGEDFLNRISFWGVLLFPPITFIGV